MRAAAGQSMSGLFNSSCHLGPCLTHTLASAGTITRTMKPRKAAIFSKYAAEVAEVEAQLR